MPDTQHEKTRTGIPLLSRIPWLGALFGTGGAAVPAFAALTAKGLSPGAALLGLLLSSALGASTLVLLWRTLGLRGFVPVLVWLACLTAALAIAINQVAPIPHPLQLPAPIGRVCAAVALLLVVLRAEQVGVRRWLAGWFAHGHHHHHHHGDPAHAHLHQAQSSDIPNGNAATTRSPAASGPSAEA